MKSNNKVTSYGCIGFDQLNEKNINKYGCLTTKLESRGLGQARIGIHGHVTQDELRQIDVLVVPYQGNAIKSAPHNETYFTPENKEVIRKFLQEGRRKIIFVNSLALIDTTALNKSAGHATNGDSSDYELEDQEGWRKKVFNELEMPEDKVRYEDCETCFIAMHWIKEHGKPLSFHFKEQEATVQWGRFNDIITTDSLLQPRFELNPQPQPEPSVELNNSTEEETQAGQGSPNTPPTNNITPPGKQPELTNDEEELVEPYKAPVASSTHWPHVVGGGLIGVILGVAVFTANNLTKCKGESALNTITNLAHQLTSSAKNAPGSFLLKGGILVIGGALIGHLVKSFSESQHSTPQTFL